MFFEGFRTIEGGVYHYQCSEFSTSNEIKTVFDNAIQRQRKWRSSAVGTGVKRSAVRLLCFYPTPSSALNPRAHVPSHSPPC